MKGSVDEHHRGAAKNFVAPASIELLSSAKHHSMPTDPGQLLPELPEGLCALAMALLPAKDASGKPSVRFCARSIAAGLRYPRLTNWPSTAAAMLPSACI